MQHYSILYRGPLSSCNYGCEYCPFAKRSETHAELAGDREQLARFVDWICTPRERAFSVLFTPWGEALIRSWYQDALARLSHQPHVRRVAIQTNISCHLKWIDACDRQKLGLWCTYHPTETTRDAFLDRCRQLDALGVRYSVGVVGMHEHLDDARWLREHLREGVYLWINAYKRRDDYYAEADRIAWSEIDPLFPINNTRHPSIGRACCAGETVFSVDGEGTMRRCHFIKTPIGNLYDVHWEHALRPTPCTNATCGCHIGYVHMPELGLYDVFGDGVLERIPARPVARRVPLTQVSASGL
jgi:MoaA/NifB/PqqE/SkfB family radical SAM enzyme